MIGLLDPAFFIPRAGSQAEQDLQKDLAFIVTACRQYSVKLIAYEEYWPKLWRELGRSLERGLSSEGRLALHALRRLEVSERPAATNLEGTLWRRGFQQLFQHNCLDPGWEEAMAKAAIRAVSTGQQVILFVRRIEGRNLVIHRSKDTTLEENTRWLLYVQPRVIGAKSIKCMYSLRNFTVNWSIRHDWRLPAAADGAKYPFCPKEHWWKGDQHVIGTVQSKPAWIDVWGNGWTRPNINSGSGYHWDVFIRDAQLQERVGLSQINVTEYGSEDKKTVVGHRHHTPKKKQHSDHDKGWACKS